MNSVFDNDKKKCTGCEACANVCPTKSIRMVRDEEGFRYPVINDDLCIDCGMCNKVCPMINKTEKHKELQLVFGGHIKDDRIRDESSSGGIFSQIVDEFCKDNYVVFGAESSGLAVIHTYVEDKKDIAKYRRSKYSQSRINNCYNEAINFLNNGKNVLFSGTPCQISALLNIIPDEKLKEKLFTVEVVCEGFPSPILLEKYEEVLVKRYHAPIRKLDYRYKDGNRWDFQVMRIELENDRAIKCDRWFSPFWIFWARRLMSRPSCESCVFRTPNRVADITLGDLWGVHLYCPELYDDNKGATLVVCNSEKGKNLMKNMRSDLVGHELKYEEALVYQRPMRVIVPANEKRDEFMKDLIECDYKTLCKKWKATEPIKVLFSKYIYGSNRQIVNRWIREQRKKKRGEMQCE